MAEDADYSSPVLNLTPDEKRVYSQLFQQADTDRLGVVTGEIAVKFFEKTKLAPNVLGEIWQLADQENRGLLTKAGFCMALRLIGHYQAGKEPTLDLAFKPAPLPRFDGVNLQPTSPTTANAPPNALQPQGSGIRIPPILPDKAAQYSSLFERSGAQNGQLSGESARAIFERAGLPNEILGRIWGLADREQKGALDITEFIIAMHLITSFKSRSMTALPAALPAGLYEAAQRRGQPVGRPNGPGAPQQGLPRQFSGPQRTSSPLARTPFGTGPGAQAPQTNGPNWLVTAQEKGKYDQFFDSIDTGRTGFLDGEQAVTFFNNSGLSEDALASIWDLADIKSEGRLNKDEFAVAMYLIRQQRSGTPLPAFLPSALIPPSMRNQQQQSQQVPAAPVPAQYTGSTSGTPQQNRSAADDLFGLDSPPSKPAQPQTVQSTGGSYTGKSPFDADPFSNNNAAGFSPQTTGQQQASSMFKPFQPTSSFGSSLATQSTGNAAAPGQRSFPGAQAPSANDDLLGDGDEEESKKLTEETTELANMSTQIGNLRNQMQDVQGKKSTNERDVAATNAQKQELQQRLAQFRSQYEQEVQAVKSLEQQLTALRADTRKLQQESAMLQGSHADLQNQHAQLAQALEADQTENNNLKSRISTLNAEISQLKPQIEKMKSEARQQKGMVAINKKQLATNEAERDRLTNELSETTKQQEAERARSMSQSPAASQVVSPAPSNRTNPFFRKTSQSNVGDNLQSPNSFLATAPSPSAFDALFGPPATKSSATPPVSFSGADREVQQSAGASAGTHDMPATNHGVPDIDRSISPAVSEPPPPPESKQFTASMLPVHTGGSRAESITSSTRAMPPMSAVPGGTPQLGSRAASRAVDPMAFGTALEATHAAQAQRPQYTGGQESTMSLAEDAMPGSFPDEDSKIVSPAPIHAAQPSTASDFDAAFADFGDNPAANKAKVGSSHANEDFYPMTAAAEDSDSSDDEDGFDDKFGASTPRQTIHDKGKAPELSTGGGPATATATGPSSIEIPSAADPPAITAQKSPPSYSPRENSRPDFPDEYHGLLPAREDPTASPRLHSVQSNPSEMTSTAQSVPTSAVSEYQDASSRPMTATQEIAPNVDSQLQQKPLDHSKAFDDFDEFDDLSESKASTGDDIFSHDHNETEYNPTFDSPAASMTTFGAPSNRQTPLAQSQTFHDFGSNSGYTNGSSMSSAFGSNPAGGQQSSSHDWDAIFSGFGQSGDVNATPSKSFPDGAAGGETTPKAAHSPSQSRTVERPAERPAEPERNVSTSSEHDDPILKRLVGMGYPRQKALGALEKFDYDINKAVDHLSS